jgi:hypothetical protein
MGIGQLAFAGCSSLRSIRLPNSFIAGHYAFDADPARIFETLFWPYFGKFA